MGHYFKRSMLVAAAEDIGAEYKDLCEGFDCRKEPAPLEKDVSLSNAANIAAIRRYGGDELESEDEEDEEDEEDVQIRRGEDEAEAGSDFLF